MEELGKMAAEMLLHAIETDGAVASVLTLQAELEPGESIVPIAENRKQRNAPNGIRTMIATKCECILSLFAWVNPVVDAAFCKAYRNERIISLCDKIRKGLARKKIPPAMPADL